MAEAAEETGSSRRRYSRRLTTGDRALAREMFALLAAVFEEESEPLSDSYIDSLLAREDFWAIASIVDHEVVGGLTAHMLPMTRGMSSEIFIYDIAVRADHQRTGVGRDLVTALREAVSSQGIDDLFVAADDDDLHALDFYRALGGVASPVTMFSFSPPPES